jgi:ketosteroid isomerase-like protein
MTTAVNQQDLTGVLGGMADDYVSLESPAEIIRGKTAYRTMLDSMAAAGKWQDLAFQTEGMTVSGDLAVEHGRWRMTFVPKSGRPVPSAGNFVHVWRRQPDGSWKLFRDISNSVPASDSVGKPR